MRVNGGTPPDIADFPQPGLMANFAKAGKVQDVTKMVNPDWLKQNYNQGYIDTATVDSTGGKIVGGVFERVNVKSIVWYPKAAFDEAGYKVPQTWAEMNTLMDQIVKDGDTPGALASSRARRPAGRPPTGSKISCSAQPRRRIMTSGPRAS